MYAVEVVVCAVSHQVESTKEHDRKTVLISVSLRVPLLFLYLALGVQGDALFLVGKGIRQALQLSRRRLGNINSVVNMKTQKNHKRPVMQSSMQSSIESIVT